MKLRWWWWWWWQLYVSQYSSNEIAIYKYTCMPIVPIYAISTSVGMYEFNFWPTFMLEWSCVLSNNNQMNTRAINCIDKHIYIISIVFQHVVYLCTALTQISYIRDERRSVSRYLALTWQGSITQILISNNKTMLPVEGFYSKVPVNHFFFVKIRFWW